MATFEEVLQAKESAKQPRAIKRTNAWKAFEREVATYFNTQRNILSGMVKAISNSDTIHKTLYIECKYRSGKEFNFLDKVNFYRKKLSNEDRKVALKLESGGSTLIVIHSEDLLTYAKDKEVHFIYLHSNKYKPVTSLYFDTAEKAKIEGKLPVVALKKKNMKGYFVVVCPTRISELREILSDNLLWKRTKT